MLLLRLCSLIMRIFTLALACFSCGSCESKLSIDGWAGHTGSFNQNTRLSSLASALIAVVSPSRVGVRAPNIKSSISSADLTTSSILLPPSYKRQRRRLERPSMQEISETVASAPDPAAKQIQGKENAGGHKVKAPVKMDPEEIKVMEILQKHQSEANKEKLSVPDEVRTLVEYNHGYAVLSTNSKQFPGTPTGSVVGFAPDAKGGPLFCFSGMSTHTQDLMKDARCSLTVAAKEFKGAQDGRANLIGECVPVKGKEEKIKAAEIYKKKHPDAFWVDYGDFTWYRMKVENVRTVGGFARAGFITGDDYEAGKPDAISAIQERVAGHMNADHRDATIAMIKHYVGIDVEDAIISSMDSKGMYVKLTRTPFGSNEKQTGKIRLPYARPVDDPKKIKAMIVEMTRTSMASQPEDE